MLYHSPWFSLAPYAEIPLTQLLAPAAERFRDKPAFLTPGDNISSRGSSTG